jgi:type II secretory pathway component GspD/PulD (secretin)
MPMKVREISVSGFFGSQLWAVVAFLCCLTVSAAADSAEPKWPAGPYKYLVVDQDVRDALVAFSRNTKIPMKISDAIAGHRMRGKMPITSAERFFKSICESYGLVWYYDGAQLHVNGPGEMKTETIDLGLVNARQANETLQSKGETDARFPIQTTTDRTLSVTGPPPYIARVREVVAGLGRALVPSKAREVPYRDEINIRVFRGGREGS